MPWILLGLGGKPAVTSHLAQPGGGTGPSPRLRVRAQEPRSGRHCWTSVVNCGACPPPSCETLSFRTLAASLRRGFCYPRPTREKAPHTRRKRRKAKGDSGFSICALAALWECVGPHVHVFKGLFQREGEKVQGVGVEGESLKQTRSSAELLRVLISRP